MSEDEPKRRARSATGEATVGDKPARASARQVAVGPDFGPRYRVIGPLGKGGMGEVFRAYDTELKGDVALKVVRNDIEGDAALARFRREIALARKVTSPNVLRVYDLAEHDGLRFLSMEYVDGEDLAALMKREKGMPIERATSIFRQVCVGLAAAHAQGVVHRDLKPQNVLVDKQDQVRVGDFGLARSMDDSALTASGAVLGSPAYMSPEQVKGDPTDERSDIYSLGIMLYQLVAGEPPFRAPTPHAVMEMRLHKKAPLLREVQPDAPASLEAICAKCLALNASARYASIAEVLAALDAGKAPATPPPKPARPRWLVPALLLGGVAAVAAVVALSMHRGGEVAAPPAHGSGSGSAPVAPPAPRKPAANAPITVLVLGFDNTTTDPVFDATLEHLMFSSLRYSVKLDPFTGVRLRKLAAELGPTTPVDDQLAAKLAERDGVRVVTVRGTIVSKGSGYTLSVIARDSAGGTPILDKSVDAATPDAVVPAIAGLAIALREALGDRVNDVERGHTGLSASLAADREFVAGFAMEEGGDDEGAAGPTERALHIDPRFAMARVQLSVIYSNTLRIAAGSEQLKLALQSIDQMSERDRLKFLGDYYLSNVGDLDRAIASYEQLLAKWPKDRGAETNVALAYQQHGHSDKALELGLRAAHDHPFDLVARGNVIAFEIQAEQIERAVADGKQMIAELPKPSAEMREYLSVALALLGKRDDTLAAIDAYERADASRGSVLRADFAFSEGRLHDTGAILAKAIADDTANHRDDVAELELEMLAELDLRLGDKAGARGAAARVGRQPDRIAEAAFVQAALGDDKPARASAARFSELVAPHPRALAKLIEAELLRAHGKPKEAMIAVQDALKLDDTPLAHFLLGRAALDAKQYADAYAELRRCIDRRGEAANGVDDVTSLRYIPQFTYYLAKAQEGLGSPEAKATYAAFLALMHDPDPDDPLVADARKHAP
jgi:tetratricopeptide (TPR) repeat protein/predicted Ser/Thr protein kinase